MYGCNYCVANACNCEAFKETAVDWHALLNWLKIYRPGCTVHLAGGEPLARPDILQGVDMLLAAGHRVAILTNGVLLPEHEELITRPVAWVVTFHRSQTSIEKFLFCLQHLSGKPVIVRALMATDEDLKERERIAAFLAGWDLRWQYKDKPQKRTDFVANKDSQIASKVINLIEPDGNVYPCNMTKIGAIGNIYDGTFFETKAYPIDAVAVGCVKNNRCGAYQTAVDVDRLWQTITT